MKTKFNTLVERYMRAPRADMKDRFEDHPRILIFSFTAEGVNGFRADMMSNHVDKGVVEVNSEYLPKGLISLKVHVENPEEENSVRNLAMNHGGVEYEDGGIDKDIFVLPNG
jgi:hypothetical protein